MFFEKLFFVQIQDIVPTKMDRNDIWYANIKVLKNGLKWAKNAFAFPF